MSVTVVIPTHNRRASLELTLRSVLSQRDVELEVVVVDDGSSDDTPTFLAALADDRVRVERHVRPRGVGVARNAGIAVAEGEWVAFVDDDDLWAPDKLARQIAAARAGGTGFAYCGAVLFGEGIDGVLADRPVPDAETVALTLLRFNPLPGGASAQLVARDVLDRVGGFDPRLHHLADWDLWIRVAHAGGAAAVDEPLLGYRMHPGNMVLNHGRAHLDEFRVLQDKHRELARRSGTAIDGAGFAFWVANAQWRAGRTGTAVRMHLDAAVRHRSLGHAGAAARTVVGLRKERAAPEPVPMTAPEWLVALEPRLG